jgi:hypothetical protein
MSEQVQSLHNCMEFLYTHIAKANIKELGIKLINHCLIAENQVNDNHSRRRVKASAFEKSLEPVLNIQCYSFLWNE